MSTAPGGELDAARLLRVIEDLTTELRNVVEFLPTSPQAAATAVTEIEDEPEAASERPKAPDNYDHALADVNVAHARLAAARAAEQQACAEVDRAVLRLRRAENEQNLLSSYHVTTERGPRHPDPIPPGSAGGDTRDTEGNQR